MSVLALVRDAVCIQRPGSEDVVSAVLTELSPPHLRRLAHNGIGPHDLPSEEHYHQETQADVEDQPSRDDKRQFTYGDRMDPILQEFDVVDDLLALSERVVALLALVDFETRQNQ